jgi:GDPmannose 4,6-dehydratase
MGKYALITGITGQDGSYLAELLLQKKYKVYGIIRRSSHFNTINIDHIRSKLTLFYGDLIDPAGLLHVLTNITNTIIEDDKKIKNKKESSVLEIYHLGAQSHVKVSFELAQYTTSVNALGTINLLEAVRCCNAEKSNIIVKVYNAATSEMFGKVMEIPQSEETPFYPRSPYGCGKVFAFWAMKNYREAYNMFICNGILFNHESERRGETFVTRKITLGISQILDKKIDYLQLGNLDAKRDWSHAKDMVYGMWLMLQYKYGDDYVLASGVTTTVRQFVKLAFKCVNIDITFDGKGVNEVGKDNKTGKILVKVNPKYFRPTEVDLLLGNPQKSTKRLNWNPKYTIKELVQVMMAQDCNKYCNKHVLNTAERLKVINVHDLETKLNDINVPKESYDRVILVTGGTGLVGNGIKDVIAKKLYVSKYKDQIIYLSSKDGDLRSEKECEYIFLKYKPTHVIHLAANVGGLFKNLKDNLGMYMDNQRINQNVLHCCHKYNVKKLLSCLSTCIYPDNVKYPIKESILHQGLPHLSNQGYSFAKRMLHVETTLYNQQYGTKYITVTPTNVYGPNDMYNLVNSHVIPALIHKCYLAKKNNKPFICFGTGKPLRQFIYSLDLAKLMLMCLDNYDDCHESINLTPAQEISIKSVAEAIADCYDYKDKIEWDTSKSDGQYKKTATNEKLMKLFPDFKFTKFEDAIKTSVEFFQNNYDTVRK